MSSNNNANSINEATAVTDAQPESESATLGDPLKVLIDKRMRESFIGLVKNQIGENYVPFNFKQMIVTAEQYLATNIDLYTAMERVWQYGQRTLPTEADRIEADRYIGRHTTAMIADDADKASGAQVRWMAFGRGGAVTHMLSVDVEPMPVENPGDSGDSEGEGDVYTFDYGANVKDWRFSWRDRAVRTAEYAYRRAQNAIASRIESMISSATDSAEDGVGNGDMTADLVVEVVEA